MNFLNVQSTRVEIKEEKHRSKLFHFIFIVDSSGSMQGSKWQSLQSAINEFLRVRNNEEELISIISFSSQASLCLSQGIISKNLQPTITNFGGGTDYSVALKELMFLLNQYSKYQLAILFMSDGYATYPENEINQLKQNYSDKIKNFQAIGFGDGDFQVLKEMTTKLDGKYATSNNETELKYQFKQFAELKISQ